MLNYSIPRVVVAGLSGGCGKTILSIALIAAWRKKGFKVVPFKKGPDYIDAGWLASAAGQPCYNLDPFLIGKEQLLCSFVEHAYGARIAVIEGNRGLYDGFDAEGTYSTAELAKLLQTPVIVVMDCTKVTRTAAALVLGLQKFDPSVKIKGVILNQVAGKRHESILRATINKYCNVPVLGAVPKLKEATLPERHMGLTPYQEHPEVEKAISAILEIAQNYLDLDEIWKIANGAVPLKAETRDKRQETNSVTRDKGQETSKYNNSSLVTRLSSLEKSLVTRHSSLEKSLVSEPALSLSKGHSSLRIGVIKDTAFQFYYPENFEELERRGVRIVEMSALTEKELPDIDALYIGGGFPETHAITIAENTNFPNSLRQAIENGLPVYAECGGLMYLGESLVLENKTYPMAGVLPVVFGLEKRPQAHGYSIIEVDMPNPYFRTGTILKGHEFHYSSILEFKEKNGVYTAFKMKRGLGIIDKRDGLCYRNVLATYTHVHALGTPEWVEGIISSAIMYRKQRSLDGGDKITELTN
ncbi:MAG: cobyrinate a,c-diamide synthase [Nitrospirae bacterium]|nr:cobyrinate a,c-diamide synthase [Nitrospirota bacterium]